MSEYDDIEVGNEPPVVQSRSPRNRVPEPNEDEKIDEDDEDDDDDDGYGDDDDDDDDDKSNDDNLASSSNREKISLIIIEEDAVANLNKNKIGNDQGYISE